MKQNGSKIMRLFPVIDDSHEFRTTLRLNHDDYCQNRQEQRRKIERDQSTIDEILSLPQIG